MGPQNPQVYDFPMAEDEAGAKGKKKRERKKPTTKESKAAKSPKTPKAAKGKNVAGQVFSDGAVMDNVESTIMSVSMNPDSPGERGSPTAQKATNSTDMELSNADTSRLDENSVLDDESHEMAPVGDLSGEPNSEILTEPKSKRTRVRKPPKSKESKSKVKRENNGDGTGSSVEADTGDEVRQTVISNWIVYSTMLQCSC